MITPESVDNFMATLEGEKKAAAYFHFSSDEVVDKHLVTISFTFDDDTTAENGHLSFPPSMTSSKASSSRQETFAP